MPRRPRQLVEGGIYHVYNRVASGEPIFSDSETSIEFLELVREVKQRGAAERIQVLRSALTNSTSG